MSDILRGDTLSVRFRLAVGEYALLPFLSWMTREGDIPKKQSLSFAEVGQRVHRLAYHLRSLNLPEETGVMILSGNCPEWIISEFAVLSAGLSVVAPYPTLNGEEVQWQLEDARVAVAIVENREQLKKLGDLDRPELRMVIGLTPLPHHPKVVSYEELIAHSAPSLSPVRVGKGNKAVQLYTSGSSGKPKGVEKSHESLLTNVNYFLKLPLFERGMSITGILPFAHIYPLLTTFLAAFGGMEIVMPSAASTRARLNPIAIRDCLKYGDADVAVLVPQFLDKVMNGLLEKALPKATLFDWPRLIGSEIEEARKSEKDEGKALLQGGISFVQRKLIRSALESGLVHYREKLFTELSEAELPLPHGFNRNPLPERAAKLLAHPLTYEVRRKLIHEVLGSKTRYIVTGGSALPYILAEFFQGLGIEVLQGFGTTELGITHAQLPSGSLPGYVKIPNTVGFPLDPEVKQRIHPETGELIISSPTIMRGYAGLPQKTSEVIEVIGDERWYHTGDSARQLDDFGSIEITGRLDRMYNNIGGEKVYPEGIEQRITEHPLVGSAVVWGDGKPHNIAVISPHEVMAKAWAEARGVEFEALSTNSEFKDEIFRYITSINPDFKAVERVQGVLIADKPFSIESGLLTSTLKVRPKQVIMAYKSKIEAMYQS